VRVTAGENDCPAPEPEERATLERIGAPPDMRLACQLRPEADISVIPLMQTERPIYRLPPPQRSPERELVVMFCDFLNRAELASGHMPQDLLYLLMRYLDAIGNAVRLAGGTISSVRPDSVCALFGLECGLGQAARQALRAAEAIERAIADLNDRLGHQGDSKVKIAISLHAGPAVAGEIGSSDPPLVMAVGEAMDVANELREAAAAEDKPFAISQPVYAAAGLDAEFTENISVGGSDAPIPASLSDTAPVLPLSATPFRERRAALQRLWSR
jgi:adenylate cyclase